MIMDEVPKEASGLADARPGGRPARRCAICTEMKSAIEFHNSRTGQFSYCRECRRAYDRRYYQERGRLARRDRQRARIAAARSWLAGLKRDVPCADCGELFPTPVMHWDHIPGHVKLGEISDLVAERTRTIVLEELKKCELVCANCHAIRTSRRATGRSSAR